MSHGHLRITEAVVLKLTDYGEADRIATLLTRDHGRLAALAPGARRSRHRFGAALCPFGHGEATLRERRGHDLPVLQGLYAARGFPRLSQELSRLSHASYACELCLRLCPEHEPEPAVFALLVGLLTYLDALPLPERPRVEPLRVFELRLLAAVGLRLSLRRCAACAAEVAPGRAPFDRGRGGVLCPPCHADGAGAEPLDGETRAALLDLEAVPGLEHGAPDLSGLSLPAPVLTACRQVLLGALRHHLGHNLRAVEFIAKLNLLQL